MKKRAVTMSQAKPRRRAKKRDEDLVLSSQGNRGQDKGDLPSVENVLEKKKSRLENPRGRKQRKKEDDANS